MHLLPIPTHLFRLIIIAPVIFLPFQHANATNSTPEHLQRITLESIITIIPQTEHDFLHLRVVKIPEYSSNGKSLEKLFFIKEIDNNNNISAPRWNTILISGVQNDDNDIDHFEEITLSGDCVHQRVAVYKRNVDLFVAVVTQLGTDGLGFAETIYHLSSTGERLLYNEMQNFRVISHNIYSNTKFCNYEDISDIVEDDIRDTVARTPSR